MGTNIITLSPNVKRFVGRQVETGRYASEEEAVNSLLEKELTRRKELAWLKEKIATGLEEAERGEFVEFTAEDIIREGQAHLDADNKNP